MNVNLIRNDGAGPESAEGVTESKMPPTTLNKPQTLQHELAG